MSNTQHTPGPYRYVAGDSNNCGMIAGKTGVLCDFVDEPTEANANRIVACLNACDGLPTEALDSRHGIAAEFWELAETRLVRIRDLLKQKEDMLTAMEDARCTLAMYAKNGDKIAKQSIKDMTAAISAARGQA